MVGGPGDIMDTLPSARGFTLSVLERGTGKYDVVYRASEENGYGFIIYNAGDKKLILKGRLGSDHKETIYAGSKELQDIRKNKYKSQDDIEFLRRTCLSGRSWLVNLQNNNYYFVAIWNTAITQSQYDALKEYLTKFPSSTTYIQMGMAGTGPSSEFQLVSGFNPKISSEKPKLSKKEKEFVKTAHMRSSELPAGYAKALQKLRNMTESNDVAMKNYQSYQAYKNYALKLISKLEKIKLLGKAKTSSKDIVTQSSVDSVLIGLGKQFPELTTRLKDLYKYSFHYSDLAKLHQKGKLELNSWEDQSLSENAEMSQSDITKIIDYSEKLQSMFDVNDNLEDWVKAKLNHACDYVATVRDYLKFYHDEKEAGTTDDQIDEKWTNTYKKSINCSNPKGFSQKAHCKARRLRQAGKHTRSKPVREIYEAVVRHMLKEFDSSMAMGALKQLNSDSKELEQMLQPNSELEDWVKAKLNLAGEYLDDVYHHLDHFGPQGRKFNEVKIAHDLDEGWKDWVAAGAIGLGAMTGKVDASKIKPTDQAAITQSVQKSVGSFMDYIKKVENQGRVGYNVEKKLWFPHKSFEGGSDTIGYGHKLQKGEDFSKGITDTQAEDLLKKDLEKAKQQVYKELGGIKLTPQQEEMFIDFVFNMGTLNKFPKFTEFALKNDLEGMKSQYKRYAAGKELKGRNTEFLKRFLAEYFGFNN